MQNKMVENVKEYKEKWKRNETLKMEYEKNCPRKNSQAGYKLSTKWEKKYLQTEGEMVKPEQAIRFRPGWKREDDFHYKAVLSRVFVCTSLRHNETRQFLVGEKTVLRRGRVETRQVEALLQTS